MRPFYESIGTERPEIYNKRGHGKKSTIEKRS
jgi:hypothetical protein